MNLYQILTLRRKSKVGWFNVNHPTRDDTRLVLAQQNQRPNLSSLSRLMPQVQTLLQHRIANRVIAEAHRLYQGKVGWVNLTHPKSNKKRQLLVTSPFFRMAHFYTGQARIVRSARPKALPSERQGYSTSLRSEQGLAPAPLFTRLPLIYIALP